MEAFRGQADTVRNGAPWEARAACPLFGELEYNFKPSRNCVVFPAQQAAVESVPGAAMGDCCYVIADYECR